MKQYGGGVLWHRRINDEYTTMLNTLITVFFLIVFMGFDDSGTNIESLN